MSSLKENIIANYSGKIWVAILNIAFVPLYIKYMGIEAYGLIGIFATILPLMTILDMGLSPTINRELARCSVLPEKAQYMRNLVRTLEFVYWGVALLVCILVLTLSSWFAMHWFKASTLEVSVINQSVLLMGLAVVFQWPVGFYSGGLMGLQKQVLFNVFNTIMWTIRAFGALLVVMLASIPVIAFFWWQLLMSVTNVFGIAILLWRFLPLSKEPAQFKKSILQSVLRFAFGMGAVSVVILIFNQSDKILLSSQISLSMFGYYSIVWQVVGGLMMLYYPIYAAFSPAITQLHAQGDFENLKKTYHKGCQFMSVAVFPVSAVLAIFSNDIMLIWTNNPVIAYNCRLLLSIIIIGASFSGLFYMPYSLHVAHGKTKHLLCVFILSLVAYIPLLYWAVKVWGVLGAAITYSIASIIKILTASHITHRLYLPTENWEWYLNDIGRPLFASVIVAMIAKYVIHWQITGISGLLTILGIYGATAVAAAAITPYTRGAAARLFSRAR